MITNRRQKRKKGTKIDKQFENNNNKEKKLLRHWLHVTYTPFRKCAHIHTPLTSTDYEKSEKSLSGMWAFGQCSDEIGRQKVKNKIVMDICIKRRKIIETTKK